MKKFFKHLITSALGAVFGVTFMVVGLLVIVPLVLSLFLGGKHAKMEPIKSNTILQIYMRGQVIERHRSLEFDFGRSLFSEDKTVGLYETIKAIGIAKSDKRISGIFLHLGDFSAGWASITALRKALEDFTSGGKWIVAYADRVDEMGYFLGSAASRMYMEPYGDFEFNGLAVQETFFKGLLDKLEVEPEIFRVGRFKAAIEPLTREQMSPENRQQTQALLDDIWSVVRTAVAKETKLTPVRVDEIATKLEVVSSTTAKASGFITDVKFMDEVEDELKKITVGEDNELEVVSPLRYLRDAGEKKTNAKKIAVIFAEGEIHSGSSTKDSIGAEDIVDDIEEAKTDDDVAAIVVRVNSPGGDALASDVIWRALRQADDSVPVVISMGDVAASGGYYIASAARYIFAEPTTITGSIGVFGMMFNIEKFFKKKAGVSFDRAITHTHADIGSMTRTMTKDEAGVIQSSVERVYKRFLDVVEESRGYEKRADLESIAEGRVWTGLRAKELGLVDELGGLNQAIVKAAEFAELKEHDYQIEFFPSDSDPLKHLLERLTGDAFSSVFGFEKSKVSSVISALVPKNGVFTRQLYDLKIR